MPKTGLSAADWRQRLYSFAHGSFIFGRGQRPAASTHWAQEISKIENCPRHIGSDRDLFGNPLQCVCSYHKDKTSKSTHKTPSSTATTSGPSDVDFPSSSQTEGTQSTIRTDYQSRLPAGWEQNMPEADRMWIGRSLFVAKGRVKDTLQLWWHPPSSSTESSVPDVKNHFLHRLFLWMPRKMMGIDFHCPACPNQNDNSLRSKGLYNRVRLVLDLREYYYLAAEYMYCKHCSATYIAYDCRLIGQLSDAVKAKFPVLLTRKYACDRAIVSLLRSRTLGNSPTAMRNNIQELHTEEYLRKQLIYLSDCDRHRQGLQRMRMPVTEIQTAPPMRSVAVAKWFLACYVRDVLDRLEYLKATITSMYGSILKIDSTKKVCKKLQGKTAKSAQWTTNVGNERGEILLSILTTSESMSSLQKMADGLVTRYITAKQDPPKVLYTDRECCNKDQQQSKYKILFSKWPGIEVRLDIWHFMRRLAIGCTSESHPLYGTFMSRLSSAIFEWDKTDLNRLKVAKRSEMIQSGIPNPSESAVLKAITKQELERHCRRRTKGAKKTGEDIESVILTLTGITDSLGVPLLKPEMTDIWKEQKRHVPCIQDVQGIQLYTVTLESKKGEETLPVFRCARGSTSLESFHFHLAKFIPGTSANAVNFQAYLLDGITRWNQLRASAASKEDSPFRTFDGRLTEKVNAIHKKLFNKPLMPVSLLPAKYTGELLGVEYLYDQTELLLPKDVDLDAEIDEGFEEFEEQATSPEILSSLDEEVIPAGPVYSSDSESEVEDEEESVSVSVDSRGIPGWDKVDALAQALINLTGISVTVKEAENIKALYDALLEYDKSPIRYTARARKPTTSRFARSKSGHLGVDAVKRCFLSGGSPASLPSKSRVVEAICLNLCDKISSPQKEGSYLSRWKLILSAYNRVRQRLLNSEKLLEGTDLILFTINETTITTWYKDHTRRDEVKMLLQGVQLLPERQTALQPLPSPRPPVSSPVIPETPLEFPEPEDTTGQASRRQRAVPGTSDEAPTLPSQPSRTTLWRKRKAGGADTGRKVYTCGVCSKPMASEGHTQFRGQRYCPHAPGCLSKEDWLKLKKEEAARKKAKKQ